MVVDLSAQGLRVMRPYASAPESRVVQIELELPGIDEIVWAKGEICFDQLWKVTPRAPQAGLAGWLRTSGIRLVAAARRDLDLLRDYVFEIRREALEEQGPEWLQRSSAYALG